MTEIRNRQNNPGTGIKYNEIYIPNDQNLGTGTYTTVLQPNALAKPDPIISIIINVPVFQLSVNINPATRKIPVLLGKADNSPPSSRQDFNLPENIILSASYKFEVNFADWKINELILNGIRLQRQTQPGTVSFWFDPKKNPNTFTEGVKYCWGIFEINSEECTIISDGKMLSAILNKGTVNEETIFHTVFDPNPNSNHMIAVTWDDKELNLYFDGELLQNVNMDLFFIHK